MATEQETAAAQELESHPGFLPPFPKTASAEAFNNISRTTAQSIASIRAIAEASPPAPPAPPIAESGDTGDNGGMDLSQRVGHLEDFAQDTRERMVRVETKLDHIEKEVSQTKWWLIGSTLTIILTVIATVIGTGIGIQQMTVTTFQAAGQQVPAQQQPPIIINVPGATQPPTK